MANSAVVGILRALLTADTAQFQAGLKSASSAARAWQKDFASIGQQATAVGKTLTAALTVPILGVGAASVKSFMDFEDSFAGVRKTVDASEPEFAALAQGFRNLSKEIPINVNELNKIGEAAGQLGIKKENILAFTSVMAQLGVTTNLSSDQAATALARLANITQMPQSEFARLGSTIVALGNNFATTEAEIVEFGLRIAGAGQQAGMTEPQILAIGTALSSLGVEAEAGGTAVQKVILDMVKATVQGGKELQTFASTAGMSAAEFKRAFEEDAAGAFTAFVTGLGEQGQSAINTLEDLGLADQRLIRSFLALAGSGDLLTRAVQTGTEAWRDNTALTVEAEKRFATMKSQLTLLWNQVRDLGIELGAALMPAMKSLLEVVKGLLPHIESAVKWFADLSPAFQTAIIGALGLFAAAGPLLFVFGQMMTAASTLAGLFTSKGLAMRAMGAAAGYAAPLFAAFWTALTGPVGLAIAGIAAVAGGLRVLTGSWDFIVKPVKAAWQAMKDVWTIVSHELTPAMEALWGVLQDMGSLMYALFTKKIQDARVELSILWALASNVPGPIKSLIDVLAGLNKEANLIRAKEGQANLEGLKTSLEETMRAGVGAADGITKTGKAAGDTKPPIKELTEEQKKYNEEVKKLADELSGGKLNAEMAKLAAAVKSLGGNISAGQLRDLGKQLQEAADAGATLDPVLEKIRAQAEANARGWAYFSTLIQANTKLRADNAKQIEAFSDREIKRLVELTEARKKALTEGQKIARDLEDAQMKASLSATDYAIMQANRWRTETLLAIEPLKLGIAGEYEKARAAVEAEFGRMVTAAHVAAQGTLGAFSAALSTLPSVILGAVQGGGGVGKAIATHLGAALFGPGSSLNNLLNQGLSSLATKVGGGFAANLAQSLSAAIPGIGALLGPALASLGGKLLGALGMGANNTKKSREGLAKLLGFSSLAELNTALSQMGEEGNRLLMEGLNKIGKNDTAAVNRWVQDVTKLFETTKTKAKEAAEETARLNEELGNMEDQLADLQAKSEPTWEDMLAAAKEFGVELGALGPIFQQQRMDAEAQKIIDAFDTLKRGGADIGGVIVGMSDELQAFVDESRKAGTKVPENLRPMLQAMIDNGTLLDENGDKMKDLSGINFGEVIKSKWDLIGEAIDKLSKAISALVRQLGGPVIDAIDDVVNKFLGIPTDITVGVHFNVDDPSIPNIGGGASGGSKIPSFKTGTRGEYVDFGAGTLAMLHGRERVVPEGELIRRGDGGQISRIENVMVTDGEVTARSVFPYLVQIFNDKGI